MRASYQKSHLVCRNLLSTQFKDVIGGAVAYLSFGLAGVLLGKLEREKEIGERETFLCYCHGYTHQNTHTHIHTHTPHTTHRNIDSLRPF